MTANFANTPIGKNVICPVCKQVMLVAVYADFWGNKCCYHHLKNMPLCYSCMRLVSPGITGGGLTYPDGRVICNICRKTEVVRPEHARILADRVKYALERNGIHLGKFSVPLKFVDQRTLNAGRSTRSSQSPTGLTHIRSMIVNGRVARREVQHISILYGLPEEHTASVLAHELGHAWMVINQFPNLDEAEEEGLAELVDYLWLRSLTTREARFRIDIKMRNNDPVYGAGFRAAYQGYQRYGRDGLFQFVKTHHRLPS